MSTQASICSELLRAAAYAAEKHIGQARKGSRGAAYINHPLAVANLLATEVGIDDVHVLQAALLHDVVEDTGTPLSDIAAAFGGEVAGIVGEVTDDKSLPKGERKRLQVVHAPTMSAGAALVKAADKTCNLRELMSDPPDWPVERKQASFVQAAQVVRHLPSLPPGLRELFEEAHGAKVRLGEAS